MLKSWIFIKLQRILLTDLWIECYQRPHILSSNIVPIERLLTLNFDYFWGKCDFVGKWIWSNKHINWIRRHSLKILKKSRAVVQFFVIFWKFDFLYLNDRQSERGVLFARFRKFFQNSTECTTFSSRCTTFHFSAGFRK